MNLLSGRMYWIQDSLKEVGFWTYRKSMYYNFVADIGNIIIDESQIKFSTLNFDEPIDRLTYDLSLKPDETGLYFTGSFLDTSNPGELDPEIGKVTCEVYQNIRRYLIYGKWIEKGGEYSWWAIIEKETTECKSTDISN
jgi:hypothetical protein